MYNYTANHIVRGKDVWEKDAFDELFMEQKRTGDESLRKALIESHMPCVIDIARHFYPRGIVERDDLINAGNIGLIEAYDNGYNPSKGKFITYATDKIRQKMHLELKNFGRTIRISVDGQSKSAPVQNQRESYYKSHGREPTVEELARDTDKSVAEIKEILLYSSYEVLSLTPSPRESRVGEDHHEYARDEHSQEQFEVTDARMLIDKIFEESKLTPRETDVLWS